MYKLIILGFVLVLYSSPCIASFIDNKKREQISDEILTVFAIENIGEIKTNWDKEDELTDFIYHRNRQD